LLLKKFETYNRNIAINSMENAQELKEIVKDRYSKIATQEKAVNASSCCGATTPSNKVYNIMMDSYEHLEGYNEDADLGLGCGLPTAFAQIKEGDTVIDLGSGAGNDCFVARHEAGAAGKVIGVDFTEAMIKKARENAEKMGYNNVEFRQGDIDDMPVSDNVADVVVSNCVLNLVPDKPKVIGEIMRVLKPGGHFSVSDIVLVGELPQELRQDAEMYAGCVAGAIQKDDYLGIIKETGFEEVAVQKTKPIMIPDDILLKYLDEKGIEELRNGDLGIYSITVFGRKPGNAESQPTSKPFAEAIMVEQDSACGPGCC
jgi:arsenite methyltransferase